MLDSVQLADTADFHSDSTFVYAFRYRTFLWLITVEDEGQTITAYLSPRATACPARID